MWVQQKTVFDPEQTVSVWALMTGSICPVRLLQLPGWWWYLTLTSNLHAGGGGGGSEDMHKESYSSVFCHKRDSMFMCITWMFLVISMFKLLAISCITIGKQSFNFGLHVLIPITLSPCLLSTVNCSIKGKGQKDCLYLAGVCAPL